MNEQEIRRGEASDCLQFRGVYLGTTISRDMLLREIAVQLAALNATFSQKSETQTIQKTPPGVSAPVVEFRPTSVADATGDSGENTPPDEQPYVFPNRSWAKPSGGFDREFFFEPGGEG